MIEMPWIRGALVVLLLLHAGAAMAGTFASGSVAPSVTLAQLPAENEAAYIRGIQKELLAHGYEPGPVDGIAGPETRAAIRAYQADAGLASDGQPSRRLLDHLKFVQPKIYRFGQPVMGIVLDVQRELAKRGYYLGPHDGLTGPQTRSAVTRFRWDARLPVSDLIDSRLLQQIREASPEIEAEGPDSPKPAF
jgi:peptidoglycan hydrolase-like protein with peptidoglycan-binding domain